MTSDATNHLVTMQAFPLPDEYGSTAIPNAVLESLLDGQRSVDQITFTLRALWWIDRSTTFPKSVTLTELRRDRVLVAHLDQDVDKLAVAVCGRGIFVRSGVGDKERLMLNTVSATRMGEIHVDPTVGGSDGWDTDAVAVGIPDAYRAYEQNIGHLTPMIREAISQSLQDFTDAQITQAIRVAVESDARSWSFIRAVLKKWNSEGMPDEREPRGDPGGSRIPETELRRYLERTRAE